MFFIFKKSVLLFSIKKNLVKQFVSLLCGFIIITNVGEVYGEEASDNSYFNSTFHSKKVKQICKTAATISIPSQDRLDEATKASLKACSSYDSNSIIARQCALIKKNYDELSQIYAYGKGVKVNLDLALHYACMMELPPVLVELRVRELQQEKDLNVIKSKWTTKELDAFQKLQIAADKYFDARTINELDYSGYNNAELSASVLMHVNQRMMRDLIQINQCKLSFYTPEQYKEADRQLNIIYQKVQKAKFTESGSITKRGIQKTERDWIKYRDAWVDFSHVKCGNIDEISLKTIITNERIEELREMYSFRHLENAELEEVK